MFKDKKTDPGYLTKDKEQSDTNEWQVLPE